MTYWLAAASAGMSLLQGLSAQDSAAAQATTAKSNAKVANILRVANNELSAAKTSLSRFRQSISNQNYLKNVGSQMEATTMNSIKQAEQYQNQSMANQLSTAEQQGALNAEAAAAGVGGGTRKMLSATLALQSAIQAGNIERSDKTSQYEYGRQLQTLAEQRVLGLDSTLILDQQDTMPVQAQQIAVPSSLSVWGEALFKGFSAYNATK